MKKTLFSIALIALLLFATSGLNRGDAVIKQGEMAPELVLANDTEFVSLSQLRGDYVLLSFWSSADAKSRIDCNSYSAWMNANKPSNMRYLAVNFDTEPLLFQEIAKRDNFDQDTQFHVQGQVAKHIKDAYHLGEGYGSILIGPDGRIVEINPTLSELSSHV